MEINDYRTCMSVKMKGNSGDMSKTERKIYFSVSAKLCSNKTDKTSDAIALVMSEHPGWFTDADIKKISDIASK